MLDYDTLKHKKRDFLAATGLFPDEFALLLPAFTKAYQDLVPSDLTQQGTPRLRAEGAGATGKLSRPEDKLLFILVYQKTNPLQTMHALQFALSQTQANFWIHTLLPVLQQALADLNMKPERQASQVAANPLAKEGTPALVLDGTERRRQRPKDALTQREHYSGKKKCHTDKNLLLVNETTNKVVYLGPTETGKKHDKKAADEAVIVYPALATLDQDTGFQEHGLSGLCARASIGSAAEKKPKGQELSVADAWLNAIISSVRIVVEHVIAGVKRCRIVKDILRLTKAGISDRVMEVACGLHNLRVTCRRPPATFDVRDFLTQN